MFLCLLYTVFFVLIEQTVLRTSVFVTVVIRLWVWMSFA